MTASLRIRCARGGVVTAAGDARYARSLHDADVGERTDSGWDWDGRRLRLFTDRLGFVPIFCRRVETGPDGAYEVHVANDLRALLRGAPAPALDHEALAVFVRIGSFVGDDTAFTGVRVVPPGVTRFGWSPPAPFVFPAGTYAMPPRVRTTREEAMRAYDDAFRRAVSSLARGRDDWGLPLSGGRDSRHILFALHAAGAAPRVCVTARHFPPRADQDARVAATVAAAVGVRHVVVPAATRRLRTEWAKNARTHMSVLEHGWFVHTADWLGRETAGAYDGIAGDVLSAGLFLDARRLAWFERGELRALADDVLGDDGYLPRLLSPAWYRASRGLARRRVERELARHVDAPNPVGSFFFWNRTRRAVGLAPFAMLRQRCGVAAPYLHPEVFALLAGLPARWLLDHTFHTQTIAASYPAFAHLPYEDKAAAQPVPGTGFRTLSAGMVRLAADARSRRFLSPAFMLAAASRGMTSAAFRIEVEELAPLAAYLAQLGRLTGRIGSFDQGSFPETPAAAHTRAAG